MPRLSLAYGLLAISLLLISAGAPAQTFSDQGLLSGSGMSVIPTSSIVPPTEFRVQISRVNFLGGSNPGMNVFGLGVGLSTVMEGYLRVTGEQLGAPQSQIAYGFGGKVRIPLLLPVVRRAAIWAERTTSDQKFPANIFTAEALRAGVLFTADSNGMHPTLLAGFTRVGALTRPLIGAGMTFTAGEATQASVELVHGYLGRKSFMAAGTITHRPFRNISFHLSPGYLTTPSASTWTLAIGFSLSTSDINFHPVYAEQKSDEFVLPSIEEMEKGTANARPAANDSTDVNSSQSSTHSGTLQGDGAPQPGLPVDGQAVGAPLLDGPLPEGPAIDGPAHERNFRGEINREEEHHEE